MGLISQDSPSRIDPCLRSAAERMKTATTTPRMKRDRVGICGSSWRLGLIAGVTVALGTACSSGEDLLVLSAASAQDGVRAVTGDQPVGLATGGSNALVRQLAGGSRGDVLITADARTMAMAAEQQLLSGTPITFATSELVLAVPRESVAIRSLTDLRQTDAALVVCAPEVPCGAAAQELLRISDLTDQVRSLEPNSRQALAKLRLGEADAALVWAVDIADDHSLRAIPVTTVETQTQYQAAVTRAASHPESADRFVRSLIAPTAQASLRELGFGAAP